MNDEKQKTDENPLPNIAISLSGGGVRAVGFHVGVLSMLDRLGLLKNLSIISSVSGGSLPGIGYSLSQHFGRNFQEFFDDFYEFLPEINIMEELMKRVTAAEPPSPSGRRDLVTALANVYDECYFKRFFGKYYDGDEITFDELLNKPGNGHLKEMIFNATEFKSGTAFRFQVSEFRSLVGNGHISICRKHAAQIRLADIMAASSCIPAGMEPLFFPDDFHWPDDGEWNRWKKPSRPTKDEISRQLIKNTDTCEPNFTLMDGGVYDNQGISSTLLALNRRKEGDTTLDTHHCGTANKSRSDPSSHRDWANWMAQRHKKYNQHKHVEVTEADLDLLIISDTPVRRASFYPKILLPEQSAHHKLTQMSRAGHREPNWAESITMGQLSKFAWFILVFLTISAGITIWEFVEHVNENWEGVPLGKYGFMTLHMIIPFLLIFTTAAGLLVYKVNKSSSIKAMMEIIPNWSKSPDFYISKMRLGDVFRMGALRAGSVSALASSIYMNRIRGLGYATAYSRKDLKGRIVSNEIFTLSENHEADDDFHFMLKEMGLWPPPPELVRIASVASHMPTKLWIDERVGDPLDDLDYVVINGQATICYNMLQFLHEQCRDESGAFIKGTGPVFDQALNEWSKLVADPVSLLYDRKRNSRILRQAKKAEDYIRAKKKAKAA